MRGQLLVVKHLLHWFLASGTILAIAVGFALQAAGELEWAERALAIAYQLLWITVLWACATLLLVRIKR